MTAEKLEGADRSCIDWQAAEFFDPDALEAELRRVFDVCQACRRCVDLCESFPRLFNLIDAASGGTLDGVRSSDFARVVDACTLCDQCQAVCPYASPHVYALDFPNLMVRYRAAAKRQAGFFERELGKTDRNGRLIGAVAALANWASDRRNGLTRSLLERIAGVHRDAVLPKYHVRTFSKRTASAPPAVDKEAPAAGRKAVIYATCFVEYNKPGIGVAARGVLARNGVETEVVYPGCCGMPQLERGGLEELSKKAQITARSLKRWIERGYDIITLIPSCALMMKTTWPLYFPEDPAVESLAENTHDISQYVVAIARNEGLAPGLEPIDGDIALHVACHARAQNIGAKSAVMLRMIPESNVLLIQRCSGHGGTWGVMKGNFAVGMKVGEPVMRQAAESGRRYVASECPLAGDHIVQGMERFQDSGAASKRDSHHPIELLAKSYGIEV